MWNGKRKACVASLLCPPYTILQLSKAGSFDGLLHGFC